MASSRGRMRVLMGRPASTSLLTSSSTSSAKPAVMCSNSKSIRAASGCMSPPVTCAPKSRQITPHSTCSAVCVRMSLCRRSQSMTPVTTSPTAGAPPSSWCTTAPSLRPTLVTVHVCPPADSVPHVVGLPAASRVEGGAVQRHAVLPYLGDRRLKGLDVAVLVVERLRHGPLRYAWPSMWRPYLSSNLTMSSSPR